MIRQRVNRINEVATPYLRSPTSHILVEEDSGLEHNIYVAFRKMFKALDEFIRKGSSWTLKKITKLEIHTASYRAIGGKSYIQLPPNLRTSKSVINTKNKDNKCFLLSVLASLHPAKHHDERVKQYKRFENDLNMNGIEYSVHPSAMQKFEKQNNFSVTVIGYEEGQLFSVFTSKLKNGYHHQVNLLYFQKNDNHHWCWIKNLDRCLYHTKPSIYKYNFCHLYLQSFRSEETLSNHSQYCSQHDAQRTVFPTKGVDDVLKYSDFRKQMFVPFVI
ncbi:Hypothetical predicted protein [Mytilus galloprovincialis]|uniref:Uncharacterized protein n=1 Tax=Mytilus galloprovincialis TaxID=29158 RepID=A0A8B6C724_MYTGA|nr:Hypothetical predicted protein [Mytilus galloprovincialis]